MLRFFVTSLSSAAKGIFSVCHRRRSASDEEIPLGRDEEGNIAYASLESSGYSNNNGVAGSSSEELRGLTAEYTSWFESKTALMYALGNLTAYLLVAVIGYSFVFEDWPIYDSVYFAMVVFTTVGTSSRGCIFRSHEKPRDESHSIFPVMLHSNHRLWRSIA